MRYGESWRSLPSGIRGVVRSAVGRLPRNETLKRGVHSLGIDDRLERYQRVFALAPEETISGLFQDGLLPRGSYKTVESWTSLVPQ